MKRARSQFFNGKADVLDLAREVIMVRDMDDRVIFWNRGAEETYGWNRDETRGKSAHQLLKTVWPKPLASIMSEVLTNDRWEGEQLDTRKDGRQLVLKSYWTLKRDDSGRPDFIFEISTDVTKQKRAEEALKESEQNYRELVDCSNSAILKFRQDGTVTFFNRFAEKFFGFSEAEIVGRNVIGTIVPKTESSGRDLEEMIRDLGSHPERYIQNENENIRKNGERVWVAWTNKGLRDKEGNVAEILSVGNDQTRYHRAVEGQLRLAAAVEAALEGVVLISTTGLIDYVNPAFIKLTGIAREELIGTSIDELNCGGEFFSSRRLGELDEATAGIWKRVHSKRTDGTGYTADLTVAPVKDLKGGIMNYVAVLCDITDQVRLEGQLRQSQKMEAIGILAGGIAHDFNNMLAVIIGSAELALDDVMDERPRRNLQQILGASQRSRELVRQILTYSRKTERQKKRLKLSRLVKETAKLVRCSLPSTIDIKVDVHARSDTILADPSQIQQVLMNLSANAADAMAESGGTLGISVSEVAFKEGESTPDGNLRPGRYIMLKVSDSGTGIPGNIRERIFEPFFTTKRPGKGTGMGLAVVFGIVKSHEGAIIAESEVGKGSTFTVFFPSVEEAEEEERHEEPVTQDRKRACTRSGRRAVCRRGDRGNARPSRLRGNNCHERD